MKKFFVLFFFLIAVLVSSGQRNPTWIGDTLPAAFVNNFEEPLQYVTIIPSANNTWQIGAPHNKPFFGSAWSLPNAIMSDTANPYPANNASSFQLLVDQNNNPNYFYWAIFIDFYHKFDTDTLKDGGFVTVSWDNGQSWVNVIDDSTHWCINPHNHWYLYGNTNIYGNANVLFNGERGWSGNSGGWVHSCLAWYCLPVKKSPVQEGDTLLMRFNFISDDANHNKEGWMIDDLRVFCIDLGSGIAESRSEASHSRIAPNPVTDMSLVTLDRSYKTVRYEIMDAHGSRISGGECSNTNNFSFSRGTLSPGLYLMRLTLDNGITDLHRIIIQ
jgi:hypothetical protein